MSAMGGPFGTVARLIRRRLVVGLPHSIGVFGARHSPFWVHAHRFPNTRGSENRSTSRPGRVVDAYGIQVCRPLQRVMKSGHIDLSRRKPDMKRLCVLAALAVLTGALGASAASSRSSDLTNPKHFFWAPSQNPQGSVADSTANDLIFHGGNVGPGAIGVEQKPAVYL